MSKGCPTSVTEMPPAGAKQQQWLCCCCVQVAPGPSAPTPAPRVVISGLKLRVKSFIVYYACSPQVPAKMSFASFSNPEEAAGATAGGATCCDAIFAAVWRGQGLQGQQVQPNPHNLSHALSVQSSWTMMVVRAQCASTVPSLCSPVLRKGPYPAIFRRTLTLSPSQPPNLPVRNSIEPQGSAHPQAHLVTGPN